MISHQISCFFIICLHVLYFIGLHVISNPFKPEFTIVIFIHYKPRIAVAILDL